MDGYIYYIDSFTNELDSKIYADKKKLYFYMFWKKWLVLTVYLEKKTCCHDANVLWVICRAFLCGF